MDIRTLNLVGGHVALDFVNTVWWHESDEPVEWLRSYEDLLHWARCVEIVQDRGFDTLCGRAAGDPKAASQTTVAAVELREALFHIFEAVARTSDPGDGEQDQEDLAVFNRALEQALTHLRIASGGGPEGRFEWSWDSDEDLGYPLWNVTWEAARLLASPEIERVGICAGTPCGWLFLDRSRNRSRRWCDMADCGNRAKVRRHYARHKNE